MSDKEEETVVENEELGVDQDSGDPEDALRGWTKENKFHLLQGIKTYGSTCIEDISRLIPDKNETQIQNALNFYKRKTANSLAAVVQAKKRKGQSTQSSIRCRSVPLSSWAKILTDVYPFKHLQNETGTALRFIANYEDIPDASSTGNIDFRDLYMTIADAIEGKALSRDMDIGGIMHKLLLETAFDSRVFIKQAHLQVLLDSINFNCIKNSTKMYIQHNITNEVETLKNLSTQQSYNPFNIPQEYLRPSKNLIPDN